MARNVYGLDLGSYEIKVYDKKKDTIWKEKNVIAIANKKEVFAVGDEAYEMFEKAPVNIQVVFPMKDGVISRFNDMQYLLQGLLKKDRGFARGAEYVIAVPTDVTEVEKKAFFDLVIHSTARAKEVNIVERGIADAVGLNLDVQNTKGLFIVNLGGDTTELSILAGFMCILSADFTSKWPERIINIHPSLIPSFCGKGCYGLHVHEKALAYGVKVTGATVHFVNEIPDGGRIISQKAVYIEDGDTPETLQRRVMEQAEWILLPAAAEKVAGEIAEKGESYGHL